MILKKININNYRRLNNVTFALEDDLTLLAGPNNSGKTSVIELLKCVLSENKYTISLDDINVLNLRKWINDFYVLFEQILDKQLNSRELVLKELNDFFATNYKENTLPLPCVKLEITYNESEDISDFIEYLCDLDENINSFFFQYNIVVNFKVFTKKIVDNIINFNNRYKKLLNEKNEQTQIKIKNSIKRLIEKLYIEAIEEKYFYADSKFEKIFEMNRVNFKQLFNFYSICALRNLDDQKNDSNYSLSKSMVDIASLNEKWKEIINNISDNIIENFETNELNDFLLKETAITFNQTLKDISTTNGGNNSGELTLKLDADEGSINNLIKNITSAYYKNDDFYLSESAQGLGYSNMVFIHLQHKMFEKNLNKNTVNVFVIEEPEAHMHPQMQNVFIKYLLDYYKKIYIQCIVTTHSSEIVRNTSDMGKLRVLRYNFLKEYDTEIYDFSLFKGSIIQQKFEDETKKIDFYDYFFTISFPDLIFADKIIMYEGDTERMYIKSVLKSSYKELDDKYISFIQVGGAYAKNYKDILEFLNIKTLIITDIDYDKKCIERKEIEESNSTNCTINYFYKLQNGEKSVSSIKQIYDWLLNERWDDKQIMLTSQTLDDGYSRTFEEAILSKYLTISMYDKYDKAGWEKIRKDSGIKFSIPNNTEDISIRDIVNSSSSNKTDFMYSIIVNDLQEKVLPNYIERGLIWLMK